MLQTLTETALARRWAPPLFARLCSQLQDTCDVPQAEVDWLLDTVLSEGIPNPALLEYILTLASDPKSVLPLETLLAQWASKLPETRTERDKILMVYIARGISQIRVTPDRANRLGEALDAILDQAMTGCPECIFLLREMSRQNVLRRLAELNQDWRVRSENKLRSDPGLEVAGLYAFDPLETGIGEASKMDTTSYTPSKTFRLLWLDSAVSRLQYLESSVLIQQLDILWPNERTATLIYELTLTVFDGCAISLGPDGHDGAAKSLWSAFLLKRLPLLLQDLLARDSAHPSANGALSRVLTTMDKKVADLVDAADLRANFIRTCIDLGVCDSAVLHVLHKTHVPRHADGSVILDGTLKIDDIVRTVFSQDFEKVGWDSSVIVRIVQEFPSHGPLRQKAVAHQLLRLIAKPSSLAVRHHIALLCGALVVHATAADQFMLHVPIRTVIDILLAHLDQASTAAITQSSGYADLGCIVAYLRWMFARYKLDKQLLAESRAGVAFRSSWARTFMLKTPGEYPTASDLSEKQTHLMGYWIQGLFGGRGIGDQALQPMGEVLAVFPALAGQVASALQTGLLSQELLVSGADYFAQPAFSLLLVPIANQMCHDLWLQRNMLGTLRVVVELLQLLRRDYARPALKIVCAMVLTKLAAALFDPAVKNHSDPQIRSLASTGANIINELAPGEAPSPEFTGSLVSNVTATVTALQRWQERSVGLPTINRQVFVKAVSVLGPQETRQLIEQTLQPGTTAKEVEVALLVIYGSMEFGQSPNRDMLDAPGREAVTQIARDYAKRFKQVFAVAASEEEKMVAESGAGSPGPAVQEYAANPSDLDIAPEPADIVLDPIEGDFSYGFDLDTGPMDLDELDSVMNFTDLLE